MFQTAMTHKTNLFVEIWDSSHEDSIMIRCRKCKARDIVNTDVENITDLMISKTFEWRKHKCSGEKDGL